MIESAADRLGFLEVDEFAAEATHAGTAFPVIFDREGVLIDGGEVGIDTTRPQAQARSEDVADITSGDAVEIDGEAFTVTAPPRHDGTGFATLMLREG